MGPHIDNVIASTAQSCFALKTLSNYGLNNQCLKSIFKSIIISKLTYASPAWRVFLSACDVQKLDSVLNKAKKWGYLEENFPPISNLFDTRDSKMFDIILNNPHHPLHFLLPSIKTTKYNLRQRAHNRQLPTKQSHLQTNNNNNNK